MGNQSSKLSGSKTDISGVEDQIAFDTLPPRLRAFLRDIPTPISSMSVRRVLDAGMSERAVLQRLMAQSNALSEEYYRNLRVNVDKT